MLDEFIKEIKELQDYKLKYNNAMADKNRLAEYIYKNELEKYSKKSYEERFNEYVKGTCKNCKYHNSCNVDIPRNILEPTKNEGWFPSYKTCGNFEWS